MTIVKTITEIATAIDKVATEFTTGKRTAYIKQSGTSLKAAAVSLALLSEEVQILIDELAAIKNEIGKVYSEIDAPMTYGGHRSE